MDWIFLRLLMQNRLQNILTTFPELWLAKLNAEIIRDHIIIALIGFDPAAAQPQPGAQRMFTTLSLSLSLSQLVTSEFCSE